MRIQLNQPIFCDYLMKCYDHNLFCVVGFLCLFEQENHPNHMSVNCVFLLVFPFEFGFGKYIDANGLLYSIDSKKIESYDLK